MRALLALVLFGAGMALAAYSFVGGYVALVQEAGSAEDLDGAAAPLVALLALALSGEAPPRLGAPLSFGALLMAAGVFTLFWRGRDRDDRRDPV